MLLLTTLFFGDYLNTLENGNSSIKILRNNINANISLCEYNIDNERKIIRRPKSCNNLRLGFGLFYLASMKGYYVYPSWVHLIGKKNNHFKLNLGFKYVNEEVSAEPFFNSLLPDVFAGYRYEKSFRRFIFRTGINLYTLYNIGKGTKF